MTHPSRLILAIVGVLMGSVSSARAAAGEAPPRGPFGLSLVSTPDGQTAELLLFFSNESCATCHPRQWNELNGALHTASHTDPLYRAFAERAREEAGPEIYAYCSGCHASSGVVSGLIPKTPEPELPPEAKAGVTCDTCHQISALTGHEGPWGEPGNASFVLSPGLVKYGPTGEVTPNRLHTGAKRDYFGKSEFCASCHTVIHPVSGLRIEHTYGEWKESVYAKAGVQCQDCHMRSVEDAIEVARTLRPVIRRGASAAGGPERTIHPHYFVGANADAGLLSGGKAHGAMAAARLRSAAALRVAAPDAVAPGQPLAFQVAVRNVGAGHSIPTGVTELRQMWVELAIRDADGRVLWRQGQPGADGRLPDDAIRFGAEAVNEQGELTYKLWEIARFRWKRTIPPKQEHAERVVAELPRYARGPFTIRAVLRYRSAPPHVVRDVMGDKAFAPTVTDMAVAEATVRERAGE